MMLTELPRRAGKRPATTSAERPSPPEPARTGETSADTGTATITAWAAPRSPPGTSTPAIAGRDGTG